jgi:small multidrug resistance pump
MLDNRLYQENSMPGCGHVSSHPGMDMTIPSKTRNALMQKWLYLTVAIISEVASTSALKSVEGFTRLTPSCIVVVGYAMSFYFLSLTLKSIPVGVAYAIWSGAGTALIALVAWIFMGQKLDVAAGIGILLIVAGVLVLNLYSTAAAH